VGYSIEEAGRRAVYGLFNLSWQQAGGAVQDVLSRDALPPQREHRRAHSQVRPASAPDSLVWAWPGYLACSCLSLHCTERCAVVCREAAASGQSCSPRARRYKRRRTQSRPSLRSRSRRRAPCARSLRACSGCCGSQRTAWERRDRSQGPGSLPAPLAVHQLSRAVLVGLLCLLAECAA